MYLKKLATHIRMLLTVLTSMIAYLDKRWRTCQEIVNYQLSSGQYTVRKEKVYINGNTIYGCIQYADQKSVACLLTLDYGLTNH